MLSATLLLAVLGAAQQPGESSSSSQPQSEPAAVDAAQLSASSQAASAPASAPAATEVPAAVPTPLIEVPTSAVMAFQNRVNAFLQRPAVARVLPRTVAGVVLGAGLLVAAGGGASAVVWLALHSPAPVRAPALGRFSSDDVRAMITASAAIGLLVGTVMMVGGAIGFILG